MEYFLSIFFPLRNGQVSTTLTPKNFRVSLSRISSPPFYLSYVIYNRMMPSGPPHAIRFPQFSMYSTTTHSARVRLYVNFLPSYQYFPLKYEF